MTPDIERAARRAGRAWPGGTPGFYDRQVKTSGPKRIPLSMAAKKEMAAKTRIFVLEREVDLIKKRLLAGDPGVTSMSLQKAVNKLIAATEESVSLKSYWIKKVAEADLMNEKLKASTPGWKYIIAAAVLAAWYRYRR